MAKKKKNDGGDAFAYAILGVSAFFLGRRLYREAQKVEAIKQARSRGSFGQRRW